MKEQSKFKLLLYKIRNFFLVIIMTILNFFKNIFGGNKQQTPPKQNNKFIPPAIDTTPKENQPITTTAALPDEDNIKTNPHNTEISTNQEDTQQDNDIILTMPKEKLFKIYTKDNELKYLTITAMLELILKEELEATYKEEKFKLKEATPKQLKEIEEIKERLFPKLIERIENNTLRNSDIIRKELQEQLQEDQLKHPLFPPKIIIEPKTSPEHIQETNKEIYTIATPKKKDINLNNIELPKIKTENPKTISTQEKEELSQKIEETPIKIVQTTPDIPKRDIASNIKEAATIATITAVGIGAELLSPTTEPIEKKEETPTQPDLKEPEKIEEEIKEEIQEQKEKIEEIQPSPEEFIEELKNIENKEELEKLKKQVEEKIEKIKEEKKEEEKIKQTEEKEEQAREKEINAVTDVSENIIEDTKTEIKKDDFFEKDYERIERQIDKMLDDITNTYLRYEDKLTDKQKKKLQAEEQKLRNTKKQIKNQKDKDIYFEQSQLSAPIHESEINGLKDELHKIHLENEQEVSNNLLHKIDTLENMTAEQVAKVDKRILLKRFNKANLILEMTSLLALPFIRNKYFFYFTAGLIVDNHFNFVNAFFNRKYNKYDPVDLNQIKQGQDALNGALDITYKNLVELEYLEQRAITKYPELIHDPRFVNQVTRLRTNLNGKYNKLMRKNKIMEKYRMKTKKHQKILKHQNKENEQEAA